MDNLFNCNNLISGLIEAGKDKGQSTPIDCPLLLLFPSFVHCFLYDILPCDYFVDNGLLLRGSAPEIDACCLYAFVTHEVGKQG